MLLKNCNFFSRTVMYSEDEGQATLDVVLSFLDECEQEEQAQQQQQQTGVSSAQSVERKKRRPPKRAPGYKPNRARDERRFELIHLRESVRHLEKELEGLRSQNLSRQLALEPRRESDLECAFSMWQGVASRQLKERLRAESENVRLKDFLDQ